MDRATKTALQRAKAEVLAKNGMSKAEKIRDLLLFAKKIDPYVSCRADSERLQKQLAPPAVGVKQGSEAAAVAERPRISREQVDAIRRYSADTSRGYFREANTYYRVIENLKPDEDPPKMGEGAIAMSHRLDEMFLALDGIREPIRLYRGISSKNVIQNTLNTNNYHDAGYVSASVDLAVAIGYQDKGDGAILVIDLPAGFKAISIEKLSRKPEEREVLLPRGQNLRVTKVDSKMGYVLFYVRPEK